MDSDHSLNTESQNVPNLSNRGLVLALKLLRKDSSMQGSVA